MKIMKLNNTLLGAGLALLGATTFAVALADGVKPSLLANRVKAAAPTDTRRVWIINNDNWWTDNNFYLHAWNSNGNVTTSKVTNILSDYYHGLGYIDVTLTGAANSLNVIVRNGAWGNNNQTVALDLGAIGSGDTVWMNSGVTWNSTDQRNDRNASKGTTNGFSGAQLAVIMSHYDTCSSANTNGYNSYPQMETNFFLKTAQSEFSTKVYGQDVYTIQDYVDAMYARYNA